MPLRHFSHIFTQFAPSPDFQPAHTQTLLETKASYEFRVTVLPSAQKEWFALIEGADYTRVEDIDALLKEEFNVTTTSWCALHEYHKLLGSSFLPHPLEADALQYVTHRIAHTPIWLLKVKPLKDDPTYRAILDEIRNSITLQDVYRYRTYPFDSL